MNADTETTKSRDLKRIVQSIFNRRSSSSDLKSYSIGDVKSHVSVRVQQHSNLVGDIFAPRVIISGSVHGTVICRELIVTNTGQLWGDVSAVSIQLQPGGQLYGWLSTLDEGTIDLLTTGEISPADISINRPEIPPEILEEADFSDDLTSEAARLILAILRNEASAAIQARSEIEITFNERLQEMLTSMESLEGINKNQEIDFNDKESEINMKSQRLPESTSEFEQGIDEAELEHLRSLVGKIASIAHQYQLDYLWTKASLTSELITSLTAAAHHKEEISVSGAEHE